MYNIIPECNKLNNFVIYPHIAEWQANSDPSTAQPAVFNLSSSSSSEDEGGVFTMGEESTTPTHETRVDKVYTVGCFDLFHRGHKKLLMNMRRLGREVGVALMEWVWHNKGGCGIKDFDIFFTRCIANHWCP